MRKNDISERDGRAGRKKEERFRLVAGLTNKSDDKICILVALLSPLLDPGLRLRRPFHVALYLRYSFAFPPPALRIASLSFSFYLLPNPESRFWPRVFQPFPLEHGRKRPDRHERSMESSLTVRLKSHESHRSADSTTKSPSGILGNDSIDLKMLLHFRRQKWIITYVFVKCNSICNRNPIMKIML